VSRLRVASFNIRNALAPDWHHSWFFRRGATAAAITQLDADVVGLQEAYRCQLGWLTSHLSDVEAVGDGRSRRRRGEHTSVLVRSDRATVVDATTRWFGASIDTPGTRLSGALFPRVATTARVRLRDGTELAVTSTHLDERSADRRLASAAQLATWLTGDQPHVLLGDFNATPASEVLAHLVNAGFRRVDTGSSGTTHHFNGRTDGRIIDHILVRGEITVVDAGVSHERPGGTLPSDHWPVWAELEIAAAR
jgi:endonuclease/exonuclease/phosphatase family metal-dependent hydrolase